MHLKLLFILLIPAFAICQRIQLHEAPRLVMPGQVDSNSPAFWKDGRLYVINSTGNGPLLSRGADQFQLGRSKLSTIAGTQRDWPEWIEAVWVDPSGVMLAWYHQEHEYVCNGKQRPNMPQIGAAFSYDGGRTFWDQGIVLSSPYPADCNSKNGYFAGGHGDFSVVLDRDQNFFYFLFSNYGGPVESQGVAVARMPFNERFQPAGAVRKYFEGEWNQPGVGGRVSPIFPATTSWQREDTDAFWGPSVHWNTHLNTFVVLMNRSCCTPNWPQEGIYATFNPDLSNPAGWAKPVKILSDAFWYPQVLGLGPGETDSLAGERARLYAFGESKWEIQFIREEDIGIEEEPMAPSEPKPEPEPQPEPQPEPEPEPEPEPGPEPVPQPTDPAPAPEPSPSDPAEPLIAP